jgi:hydrogenase maturation protease
MSSCEDSGRILIVGYGNALRGDDGLGPLAAERLLSLVAHPCVRVQECHQLLPELAEDLSRAELAVFIDICCDRPPGQIVCQAISPTDLPPQSVTHSFGPATLLAYSQKLFGHCPAAYIVSVGGESFGLEEKLSPRVSAAFETMIQRVCELAQKWAPSGVRLWRTADSPL